MTKNILHKKCYKIGMINVIPEPHKKIKYKYYKLTIKQPTKLEKFLLLFVKKHRSKDEFGSFVTTVTYKKMFGKIYVMKENVIQIGESAKRWK